MWLYNSGPALNDDGCINAAKGKVVTLQKLTINLSGFMHDVIQRHSSGLVYSGLA